MTLWSWESWRLDTATWGWLAWLAFFPIWETYTALTDQQGMLTDHLRPVFLSSPVVWFTAFGVWLWLGIHLLAPALEAWIVRSAGGA